MIKNLVFDLGSVILKDTPRIVIDQLDLNPEERRSINEFFSSRTVWRDLNLGLTDLESSVMAFNFTETIDQNTKDILIHYYQYRPLNDELLDLIKRFKASGYKIYLLSNNNRNTERYLLKLPIIKQLIDGHVFSCDYGLANPDPLIYLELFQKYNLRANECFFVDDKKTNIDIGKQLGMRGFVFDEKKPDIISDLEASVRIEKERKT